MYDVDTILVVGPLLSALHNIVTIIIYNSVHLQDLIPDVDVRSEADQLPGHLQLSLFDSIEQRVMQDSATFL